MTRIATARLSLVALLATVLLTLAGSPASAHGDKAYDLVRQAIALLANSPNNHDAIAHKIDDALKAKDTSKVQMPLVGQAKEAFESGDLHQCQRLLEQSIGARIHTTDTDPVPIGSPPPTAGAETPVTPVTPEADASPVAVMAEMPGRGGLTGGDWVMLIGWLVIGLGGIALAVRMRPHLPRHLPGGTTTGR